MVNEDWFSKIESTVFTQIEYMMTGCADAPFPGLHCTTKSQTTITNFPTLYLHELEPVERGQDLDNVTVNAVMSTIEIQVWANTTETDCKSILYKAITEMKRMRFNVIMFPSVTTSNKVAWGVARFRRMIGGGDTL